ncbi:hypothetical protein [Nocardia sp. NRRL S-836]|uniref:hypothetical protein n=1 Tax=Nocardia sp. NRRL S-836 TaxID=1519492 RepID=UPI0006AE181E|nr:hypothetical protein ADL03_27220 [Nocardia sp. NRRL S-836]
MLAATTWRGAEASFSGKQGDTVTVRTDTVVGGARVFNRAANQPIVIDEVKEVGVDIKLNTYLYKGINLPDEQLTLNVRDFTSQIATPQAKSVARAVETMVGADQRAHVLADAQGGRHRRSLELIEARKRLNKAEVERKILRRIARRSGLRSTRTPHSAGDHADLPDTVPVVYADGRPGEPMPWRFVEYTEAQGEVPPPAPAAHTDGRQSE